MKRIIKGVLVPVVIAVIIGFILGKYVFRNYRDSLYNELSSSKLYLVLNGEYDSIEAMREDNSKNNYVYYLDDDKYKTVVGITNDYHNIAKIKELYSDDLMVDEFYVPNDKLDKRQFEYDTELARSSSIAEVKEVVDNILELYHTTDSYKLVQIS